jgi:NADH dehydrogenase/NADH:ubiquinone oxidoreductase subunit G
MVILGTAPLYLKNGSSVNRNCLSLLKKAYPSLQVNILNTGANSAKGLQDQLPEDNVDYIPGLYRLGLIFEAEGLPQDYTCCNNEVFIGSSLSDVTLQRSRIQLFLPSASHFEQKGSFINMAGTVQTIKPVVSAGGDSLRTVDIIS